MIEALRSRIMVCVIALAAASLFLATEGSAARYSAPAAASVPSDLQGIVELETDSPAATSVRMAEDLASVVGDGATRRVLPIIGSNALQTVIDLMRLRGIDMAILPTDAVAYARQQRLYPGVEALTYVSKLYGEEFHLLARRNVASIGDLANQKVSVGVATGGTAITTGRIFQQLAVPVMQITDDPKTALAKLRSGDIAALAYVGEKPAPLFLSGGLKPEDGLHFLSVSLHDPLYQPAQLTAEDYPGLVPPNTTIDTVSVTMALFVAPFPENSDRYKNVARAVNAYFTQFQRLQESDHDPNWTKLALDEAVGGWQRFAAVDDWIKRNATAVATPDQETLKAQFFRFLDARAAAFGTPPLSASEKEVLFNNFRQWEGHTAAPAGSSSSVGAK
jgi:uncharacterized protein